MRRGFTLTELMIVIMTIAIVAGLSLAALNAAAEFAKEQRTIAIIAKLDSLLTEKYDDYQTRPVPIRITADQTNQYGRLFAPRMRLYGIRELMRLEMPDRVTDVLYDPVQLSTNPPVKLPASRLQGKYRRLAARHAGASWFNTWTEQYQGSECLYLILTEMLDGDKQALDYFSNDEIGDTDGDGMREILDGWRRPIEFLRWAPGYVKPLAATMQHQDFLLAPDPFDPSHCDPRWLDNSHAIKPYTLYPLVYSAGRDGVYDMTVTWSLNTQFRYSITNPPNDPYYNLNVAGERLFGTPFDFDGDGLSADNITNHFFDVGQN